MSGPTVTYVPAEDDGRPVHVLHNDVVLRLTIMQARLLQARLATVMKTLTLVVGGMNDYQRRYLHALLREHGATGDDRFPILSKILGREVGSTNDLTPADADLCIDTLRRTKPARSGTDA